MSDPVTNADVEDVLSSIRKLVSNTEEKLHPAPKPKTSDAQAESSSDHNDEGEAARTPMADALVLTSALRVSDPETEDDEAQDVNPDEGSAVLDNLRTALSQDQGDEYEEDAADENIADAHEDLDASAEEVEEPTSSGIPELNDPESDMEPVHDVAEDELPAEDLSEDEEADKEEPVEIADWSAESVEQAEEPAGEEVFETQEDSSEGSVDTSEAEPEPEPDHSDAWETDTEPQDHDDDAPDNAEEEEVWTNLDGEAEPEEDAASDEIDEDRYADNQLAAAFTSARRHNEMRGDLHLEGGKDDTLATVADATDASQLGDLDEAVVDEETLRELVAEIVRQELTGTLGERITRNVRKLVRREIHRAMLTRDFD